MNIRKMTLISILATIIVLSGFLKIPSPLYGAEFQLSAPIAVIIAMLFGFKIYITAGMIASILSLSLAMTTITGVMIAMVFRVVVGLFIGIVGVNRVSLSFSGPLGSIFARLAVSVLLKANFITLVLATLPGIVFTMIVSNLLYARTISLVRRSPFKKFLYEEVTVNV